MSSKVSDESFAIQKNDLTDSSQDWDSEKVFKSCFEIIIF